MRSSRCGKAPAPSIRPSTRWRACSRCRAGGRFATSGCGKTTMLRIIAGLDAEFDGAIARPPGAVGMVFQEPRLLPWRTVDANIRLIAPAIEETTLAALFDTLGLATHRSHFPGELSL